MLHAVAVAFKEDQVPVMDEPVDHGCRHLVIREDAPPFGEFQVGGQQEALTLVAVGDHPEQELGSVPVNRDIAPLVQDQQVEVVQLAAEALQRAAPPGFRQLQDELRHGIEAYLVPLHAGTDPGCDRHVRLADAHRTIEDEVVPVLYEPDILQFLAGKCRRQLYSGRVRTTNRWLWRQPGIR